MLLEHWHERWRRNEIGFHQDTVNPYLERYWPQLGLEAADPVFVPLCGKSLDMRWLHDRGHPVLGVEVSPIAVKDFFAEHGIQPRHAHAGPFEDWTGDGIRILCGDFFALTPGHVAGCRGVYDRASLIALPVEDRRRYADHLVSLVHPRAQVLLVTLNYPDGEMTGPPFAVTEQEVRGLYDEYFDISLMESAQVLDQNPRFRDRGLTRLEEAVYLMKPRG
jgi:thiopurine S-methyltransferase